MELRAQLRAVAAMPDAKTMIDQNGLYVSVDLNRCQGYAQCCYAAPEQFSIRGHEALFYDPAPPISAAAAVERARAACPVQAIRVGRAGSASA